MQVPDTLKEKMELFRRHGRVAKYREGVFLDASWIAVYIGQRVIPEGYDLRADLVDAGRLDTAMAAFRNEVRSCAEAMPDHRTHIEHYCPMAVEAA
jgi:tryptophan halogenase